MGRNLSPILRRELANLDKDADSRKSAMKALKSYVKDLDSEAIPQFLAQVSGTKGPGSSGEYTISLYEVLARVHGRNIVPQIDNIMTTIVKTLTSSPGSFPLHQACSKVVPAIARYGIDPSTPEGEKAKIIESLCKPLFNTLMGPADSIASGAALCLKALVESDNWRYASDDVVNNVCLRVAGALEEKNTQTNSHMALAMALGKHNSLILEAYARSLIRSGLQILTNGATESGSQKKLSAIQMINFLMKCVDSRSIFSEMATIIDVMEKCNSDHMPFVRGAAFEALQTARLIALDKGSKLENDSSSFTGSNFSRARDYSRRNLCGGRDNRSGSRSRSPRPASPESQTINSFNEYDSFLDSPLSAGQASCNFRCASHVNRKLWKHENGGVDVSLKDGLYSKDGSSENRLNVFLEHFGDDEPSGMEGDHSEAFSGFLQASPTSTMTCSVTPSPQRPLPQLNINNIGILTTPRKLIRSLQEQDDVNSDFSDKQSGKIRSLSVDRDGWNQVREANGNGLSENLNDEVNGEKNSEMVPRDVGWKDNATNANLELDGFESVSSTGDVHPEINCREPFEATEGENNRMRNISLKKPRGMRKAATVGLVCGLTLILPAAILATMWFDNQEEYFNLVPT